MLPIQKQSTSHCYHNAPGWLPKLFRLFFLLNLGSLSACSPKDQNIVLTQEPPVTKQQFLPSKSISSATSLPETRKTVDPITPISNIFTETVEISVLATLFSSPLAGIELSELDSITSNPFSMPQLGKDDGHHGIDFAFYQYKTFSGIDQNPIQSIFSGTVTLINPDRPPYGNFIIIETPLNFFSDDIQTILMNKIPDGKNHALPYLSCPDLDAAMPTIKSTSFSLYALYAHLDSLPLPEKGAAVSSGDNIGFVGNTGMSGNPHLHLEFRVGPSNADIGQMAHYDNTVSPNEIKNYCLWRVSGLFQMLDPMQILLIEQKQQ